MALAIDDTLEFLLGAWAIERTIDDHRDGASVRFSGTAEVTRVPAGAVYLETGHLITAAGRRGPARRALGLRALDGGAVGIDFADGRPFLDLDLSTGDALATHPCRADSYEMAFTARGADELAETWRVTGPAKDYSALTIWRRR